MTFRWTHVGAVLSAGSLVVAGCSSDDDGGSKKKDDPEVVGTGGGGGEGGDGPGPGENPNANQYGVLTSVDFTSNFLLDPAKMTDPAVSQGYQQAHQDGFQGEPAFIGTYQSDNSPIPPPGAAYGFAHATTIPAIGMVVVRQIAVGSQNEDVFPQVLVWMSNTLGTGKVRVPSPDATVVVMDRHEGECAAAFGFGEIQIGTAVNIGAEGGKLSLFGTNVLLYHPLDTPDGDMSLKTAEVGSIVCPRK